MDFVAKFDCLATKVRKNPKYAEPEVFGLFRPGNISPPESTFIQARQARRRCTFFDTDEIGARRSALAGRKFLRQSQQNIAVAVRDSLHQAPKL